MTTYFTSSNPEMFYIAVAAVNNITVTQFYSWNLMIGEFCISLNLINYISIPASLEPLYTNP
jgi:hypothetical protein